MPMPFRDKTGQIFGAWTVLGFAGRDNRNATTWHCRCACGAEKVVVVGSLTSGKSKSCGCMAGEMRTKSLTKHGMAGTPTYKSWHQMHQRCQGKHGHDHYVRNGITVCERWHKFENFFEDMGPRPDGTTLDRIDFNGNYEPGNCRWADTLTQANNRGNNIRGIVLGEEMTATEAARKFGRNISGVRHRLRKGWSLEASVVVPPRSSAQEVTQ